MFETSHMMKLTDYALSGNHRDIEYYKCWANLPRNFNPKAPGKDDGETLGEWLTKHSQIVKKSNGNVGELLSQRFARVV